MRVSGEHEWKNESEREGAALGRNVPQINFVAAREDSLLLACDPGPCGGCGAMHSFFICREGKSLCVECDRKERELKAEGATA